MSHVEPLWLRGEKESKQGEVRVQRVEYEEARQFVVLPFYENGDVKPGEERYMLWGRALSDGIPPTVVHHVSLLPLHLPSRRPPLLQMGGSHRPRGLGPCGAGTLGP
jgi:hypothetical protein